MTKIIVFDGMDGTGKNTQSRLLKEHIEKLGKTVRLFSFPNYTSKSSSLVKKYLSGEFSDTLTEDLSSLCTIASLFAYDRYQTFRNELKDIDSDFIIFDRYIESNLLLHISKLNKIDMERFLNFVEYLEYDLYQLPKADMGFVFISDPMINMKMIEKRSLEDNRDIDILENFNSQCKIIKSVDWLRNNSSVLNNFHIIHVDDANFLEFKSTMRPIEDIHSQVIELFNEFNLKD